MNGKGSLTVVGKNVRKRRSREMQSELMDWIEKSNCDVCAVNETGLIREEYMEGVINIHTYATRVQITTLYSDGITHIKQHRSKGVQPNG